MYGIFATKNGYIGIIGVPPEARDTFFIAVEHPELALDPRFQGLLASREDMQFLFEALTPAFKQKTTDEWCEVLRVMGVRYAPVRDYRAATQDPGIWENGYLQSLPNANGEQIDVVGTPISMSDTPLTPRAVAPTLGQDTDAALTDIGYSAEEIAALKAQGVI